MKILGFVLEFGNDNDKARRVEALDIQAVRRARRDWLGAHRNPLVSSANKILVQCTPSHFVQYIANPLRRESIEADSQLANFSESLKRQGKIALWPVMLLSLVIMSFLVFSDACSDVCSCENKPSTYIFLAKSALISGIPFLILGAYLICKWVKQFSRVTGSLTSYFDEKLASIRQELLKKLKQFLKVLLALHARLISASIRFSLARWIFRSSAGGLPATSEQHALSLLSAHLSTFERLASYFISLVAIIKRGGRADALAII